MRRGLFRIVRGTGYAAHIVLALFQQLQLPAQHQNLLLLQRQCIIELAHHIFLVGKLGLHVEQLLDNFFDIGQVRLSPGLSLFPLTKR